MRIVFVIRDLTNGGAERGVTAFVNALAALGEDVHLACIADIPDDYDVDPGVSRHLLTFASNVTIPKLRGLCKMLHPAAQIRRLAADVVISVNVPAEYYREIFWATRFSKTRLVYSVVNNIEKKSVDKAKRRRWKKECFLADAIWLQTSGQRRFFPRFMQKKIFEAQNILDSRFLEVKREKRTRVRRFISVGRLHPQKDQKRLIAAFADMVRRTQDQEATLTIYGKSGRSYADTETELRTLIRQYQLEERIFLPGRVSDIAQKYEEADAFVFSSVYEGCPYALMEAMGSGLPCVSTDCPTGPSDLITNGKDGILVPVGDVQAMSLAMQYLLEHPQEAYQMGMAARQRMREWGSPQKIARQLLRQFQRICS